MNHANMRIIALCGALMLLTVTASTQVLAQAPGTVPGSGARPLLPGQAPPIPLPDPGVMAQAPARGGTAAAPAPAATPVGTPAVANKPAATPTKQDTLTLADVEGKLTATRDLLWQVADRKMESELLKAYDTAAGKLSGSSATAP